jgi:hypothetical protein
MEMIYHVLYNISAFIHKGKFDLKEEQNKVRQNKEIYMHHQHTSKLNKTNIDIIEREREPELYCEQLAIDSCCES